MQRIMVSCDLVGIPTGMLKMVRDEVQKTNTGVRCEENLPECNPPLTQRPVLENDLEFTFRYQIPKKGVFAG